jgi:hypothetical protein
MPGVFNKPLWDLGRRIEDTTLPIINRYFNADFKRDENIFDILDFHDVNKKIICEIKGRTTNSYQYRETIIPYNKVVEGHKRIEQGYRVFFIFVFKDKTMEIELKKNTYFEVKLTGTHNVEHALIPVKDLLEVPALHQD